jgi:putative FmdB family regulatory protein
MPLYEYRCQDCGVFEEWRSLSEVSLPSYCPTCQRPGKRIFSPPAVLGGAFRLKQGNPEPQLIQRDLEPQPQRIKSHTGGRPWMISH